MGKLRQYVCIGNMRVIVSVVLEGVSLGLRERVWQEITRELEL